MSWLAEIRGDKSQYKVAEEIGIPQSTYASMESGARNPSVAMAKKIAAAMGFDWTKFFENTEQDSTHLITEEV